jgi:hypothetical protein
VALRIGTAQTAASSAGPGQPNSTLLPEMFRSRQYPKIIADVGLSNMSYELKWFAANITLSTDWLTQQSSVLYQLTYSREQCPLSTGRLHKAVSLFINY